MSLEEPVDADFFLEDEIEGDVDKPVASSVAVTEGRLELEVKEELGRPAKRIKMGTSSTSWATCLREVLQEARSSRGKQLRPAVLQSHCSGLGTHKMAVEETTDRRTH